MDSVQTLSCGMMQQGDRSFHFRTSSIHTLPPASGWYSVYSDDHSTLATITRCVAHFTQNTQ